MRVEPFQSAEHALLAAARTQGLPTHSPPSHAEPPGRLIPRCQEQCWQILQLWLATLNLALPSPLQPCTHSLDRFSAAFRHPPAYPVSQRSLTAALAPVRPPAPHSLHLRQQRGECKWGRQVNHGRQAGTHQEECCAENEGLRRP